MFTNCTSPLIKLNTYENILKIFNDIFTKSKFDSLNTVTEIKEFLFENGKPINFKLNETPNSQNLPDIVKLNFAINILKTEKMSSEKSLIGKNPYLYKLDEIESLDINSEYEFAFAEYLFDKINIKQ